MKQQTIKHSISCVGIGVHSGKLTSLSLYPAPEDSGITFIRTDIKNHNNKVSACYKSVSKTRLGTTIQNTDKVEIATIEHLMAALWGFNIDNIIIELDGPEIPIMDGSSEKFLFMLECAGTQTQDKPRKYIELLKEISIKDGDSVTKLYPSDHLSIEAEISFDNSLVPKQKYNFSSKTSSFKHEISRARTFGFEKDAEILKQHGFARGASLDNVIVISGDKILNKDGLRYKDEFVRHKLLDLIGDFYLAGAQINAHIETFKPGHTINNKVLHTILSDKTAWRIAAA